jgi:hypothetical protein
MITKASAPPCGTVSITDIDGNVSPSWSIAGKQQKQFLLTGTYSATGTCTWFINAGPGMTTFNSTFEVNGAHPIYNAQPKAFSFVVSGVPSETQYGILQNLSGGSGSYAAVVVQETTGGNTMSIVAPGQPCDGTQTCPGAAIAGGAFDKVAFKCTPGATAATGNIQFQFGGSMPPISVPFTCARSGMPPVIDIMQTQITLQGPVAGTATGTASVMASGIDSIASAAIIGADASAFHLTMPTPACNGGTTCTWTPAMPIGASVVPLTITCSPSAVQKTAKLRVVGTAHADDIDEADLACVADSGASTSPTSLAFGDVRVTTTSAPQMFTITNLSATQPVSVGVDTGHPDWIADACVTSACTIPANGTQVVQVQFKPSVPAQNDRTLSVTVGGMQVATVDLTGNGIGSRLRVLNYAAPYVIDFGTIGLGATRTRPVQLEADGNRSLNVAIGTPGAPFSTSVPAVDLAAGTQDMFDVRCSSPTPGTFDDMVTLIPGPAMHVYAADTPKLDVKCTIANTPVEVMPDALDFGEVLRNTQPPFFDIEIHNPSAMPISLDYVRLTNEDALTITQPIDTILDPDETLTATLTLSTAAEVTVQSALEIGVGGEELVTPITGKVVTASARVTPTSLKLGSVCVGTTIDEPVNLVNDGTATLRAFPPMMDAPFAVGFVNPTSYPPTGAVLGPTESATANVRLSTATPGDQSGKLTWDVDDAPGAPFVIEATVEVKDTGTAVSPQALAFDKIPVGERSSRRTVRVQNCGDVDVAIETLGVTASHSRADAWEVMPAHAQQVLRPGDRFSIDVRFAPTKAGFHVAEIQLAVDGTRQAIELTGEAIGDSVERTSLYACDCNTHGGQSIVFAGLVLLVICRRRTGSSSPR